MRRNSIRAALALLVAIGTGTFSHIPEALADGSGGGGGATDGGGAGGGEVSVVFVFSPAPRTALASVREIYITQEDGAFVDVMKPSVSFSHEAGGTTFAPARRLGGITSAIRKYHHPDAFTYLFAGRTMEGLDVTAEFPVVVAPVGGEVEWEDDGVAPNALDPLEEIHVTVALEPDEIEIPDGGSVDVVFEFSLRDHFGNPVSGIAPLINVLLQSRVVAPPGTDVRWNGGAGPVEVIETAVGTYHTATPHSFLEEGEFDLSLWIDFDTDTVLERGEVFTLTIEAEEE